MLRSILFMFFILPITNCYSQYYPNIENQMLSNSLNSFLYYESKNFPHAFSDPNSLRDTEFRSQLLDQYHDSLHYQHHRYLHNTNNNRNVNGFNINIINGIYIDRRPLNYTNPYRLNIP